MHSDLFLSTKHVSDAEVLAHRMIGMCIKSYLNYSISHTLNDNGIGQNFLWGGLYLVPPAL